MKTLSVVLALASSLVVYKTSAVSFDDIQFWVGEGTNRAALVIEWTTPESMTNSTVPAPIADKSLVWGYRFNGTNIFATQMVQAIAAADPRFYVVDFTDWGPTFIVGLGYNLTGGVALGLTDGVVTNYFIDNFLTNYSVDIDAAAPLNTNDLYWGGLNGPSWEFWTEAGAAGGFTNCPDRGTNAYWTPTDPSYYVGSHGQWDLAQYGLDSTPITDGSWIGFSVTAGEYEGDTNAVYNTHKHAPKLPDPTITALVKNLTGSFQDSQWQAQFLSVSNWNYSLERSTDLQNWSMVVTNVPGNCSNLFITDSNAPINQAFYRVRADQP